MKPFSQSRCNRHLFIVNVSKGRAEEINQTELHGRQMYSVLVDRHLPFTIICHFPGSKVTWRGEQDQFFYSEYTEYAEKS